MVGEIGCNDYNYALFQGKTIKEVMIDMVPEVVQAIKDAVTVSDFLCKLNELILTFTHEITYLLYI